MIKYLATQQNCMSCLTEKLKNSPSVSQNNLPLLKVFCTHCQKTQSSYVSSHPSLEMLMVVTSIFPLLQKGKAGKQKKFTIWGRRPFHTQTSVCANGLCLFNQQDHFDTSRCHVQPSTQDRLRNLQAQCKVIKMYSEFQDGNCRTLNAVPGPSNWKAVMPTKPGRPPWQKEKRTFFEHVPSVRKICPTSPMLPKQQQK